jgi:hypothetical protein
LEAKLELSETTSSVAATRLWMISLEVVPEADLHRLEGSVQSTHSRAVFLFLSLCVRWQFGVVSQET